MFMYVIYQRPERSWLRLELSGVGSVGSGFPTRPSGHWRTALPNPRSPPYGTHLVIFPRALARGRKNWGFQPWETDFSTEWRGGKGAACREGGQGVWGSTWGGLEGGFRDSERRGEKGERLLTPKVSSAVTPKVSSAVTPKVSSAVTPKVCHGQRTRIADSDSGLGQRTRTADSDSGLG